MAVSDTFQQNARELLTPLYGDQAEEVAERIARLADEFTAPQSDSDELWSEQDAVLITYGAQVHAPDRAALGAQQQFLAETGLDSLLSTIHLLPFYPWSSDDGFSVIDYRAVDAPVGSWEDVAALHADYDLMFDLVLNHCSARSEWFQAFIRADPAMVDFFVTADPQDDLSQVTRPRSLPLLTPTECANGLRHVWTTFSADQVDLNYANPDVLIEMLDILLFYVSQGARIVRLDAIAFLWKEIGTTCIHLPQTHAVVKLMRLLMDEVSPRTILLTETNVPHEENISYIGDGDEARMVYQFSLGPLLLDAFLTGDATTFVAWLDGLGQARPGTTWFNFTASHDGIGVRPLEGLVPAERLQQLVDTTRSRGGQVSMKSNPDGTESPYELNITWFSVLADPGDDDELRLRRFLSSQAMMLAVQGIPGIYFHSLIGTPNDHIGMERTGRARSINRRTFDADELRSLLADADGLSPQVLAGYQHLLRQRIAHRAFHPDAPQQVLSLPNTAVIGFRRTSVDGSKHVWVFCNVSNEHVRIDRNDCQELPPQAVDLIGEATIDTSSGMDVPPYATLWLTSD